MKNFIYGCWKKRRKDKPRIIYFQQNPTAGACEEYFYLLLEGIDKVRFETSLVCPEYVNLNSWISRIEKLGVQVYRYPSDNGSSLRILYLRSLFRKLKPDLVHFNDP